MAWATASGTAIANSTTETILVANVTIPANYMQDGRVLRLTAFGGYGTTATPTLQFRLRWGGVSGTVFAATGAITTTSAVGGGASMTAQWEMMALLQVRSNGSSGTLMANGRIITHTNTALTAGTVTNYGQVSPLVAGATGGSTPAVATLDFTADTALSFTAQWSAANSANSIQLHNYLIETLN
jgi:hypothetical protein